MNERPGPILARGAGKVGWRQISGPLFRKYVLLFIAVVCVALISNGIFEVGFSYREHKASLIRIQGEQAAAAAKEIDQFIEAIKSQVGWTTQLPWSAGTIEARRFDGLRLLRQVPAITELAQLDATGKEQLKVSRLAMDVVASQADYSKDPKFIEAVAKKVYYGPVYFRRESEPYMTLALAGTRRDAGVSVAEVNLKLIWEVISQDQGRRARAGLRGRRAGPPDRAPRHQPGAAQHRHDEARAGEGGARGGRGRRGGTAAGGGGYPRPPRADRLRAGHGARLAGVRRVAARGGLRAAHRLDRAFGPAAAAGPGARGPRRHFPGAPNGGADPGPAGRR